MGKASAALVLSQAAIESPEKPGRSTASEEGADVVRSGSEDYDPSFENCSQWLSLYLSEVVETPL